jgi:hypothetical protein
MFGIPNNDVQKHDVPNQAREIDNLNKQLAGPEPLPAYNAKYPYNKVFRSESGHVFEIDDTPNYERIHTYHRSGSYREVNASGRRVEKIVGDDYEIVLKDKTLFVKGNLNITVEGNVNCRVNGNYNLTVDGTYNVSAANKNETVKQSTNIRYEGVSKEYFGSDYYIRKQAGKTDYACPADIRGSGIDCGEVPSAPRVGE